MPFCAREMEIRPYTSTRRQLTTCLILPCAVWSSGCVPEPSPSVKCRTPAMQSFSRPRPPSPSLSCSVSLLSVRSFVQSLFLSLFLSAFHFVLFSLCFVPSLLPPSFAIMFLRLSWLYGSFAVAFLSSSLPRLSCPHLSFVSFFFRAFSFSPHGPCQCPWDLVSSKPNSRAAPRCAIYRMCSRKMLWCQLSLKTSAFPIRRRVMLHGALVGGDEHALMLMHVCISS